MTIRRLLLLVSVLVCITACGASPSVGAASPDIRVYFSPDGGGTEAIVGLIGEARKSIRVAAYSFTSAPIAKALVQAHRKGIDVEVVLEKSNNSARYGSATFLANEGIPTRINARYAIMHKKFLVVDGETVETGSFNYTKAAEQHNAENVLVLRRQPSLAARYVKRWQQLWDEGEAYRTRY